MPQPPASNPCSSVARLAALLACVGTAACAGAPAKPDVPATTPHHLGGVGRAIPELSELVLADTAPAPELIEQSGSVKLYRVGDLEILHKATPANSVVAARLYIRGGALDLTSQTAGIEELALTLAVTGGTLSTPQDQFNQQLDGTGSAVFSFSERDYSGYGMKSLVDHFDPTWELFTQAILEPALPPEEIEIRRTKQIADVASMLEDPDSHLTFEAGKAMFAGHPYENLQIGTAENLASFTRDELLAFQRAMLVPANMLLVVVGNVSEAELLAKVGSSLGRLPARKRSDLTMPPFTSQPGVKVVERQLPTHYILGYFEAPAPGEPDHAAMLIAMDHLSDRLFEEVRTKRNLTYAVSAGISTRRKNVGYLYVTANEPQTTLKVIFDEVQKLKSVQLRPTELEQTKNVFITHYYVGLETNASQAGALARAHLIGGDWKRSERLLVEIDAVTPADIQRVAKQYLDAYRFAVVGPTPSFSPEVFRGE